MLKFNLCRYESHLENKKLTYQQIGMPAGVGVEIIIFSGSLLCCCTHPTSHYVHVLFLLCIYTIYSRPKPYGRPQIRIIKLFCLTSKI